MSERFETFTERARKVLTLAQEEAQRMRHNYIGTEHILLGLVREGDGVAARVLFQAGFDIEKGRAAVLEISGTGERAVFGTISLTPQAKALLDESVQEARQLKHHYIGTEHLLLGLLNQDGGFALDALKSTGIDPARLRQETLQILERGTFKPPAPTRKVGEVLEAITGVFKSNPPPTEQSSDRFEKFTERARKVLNLAQEEAKRFNHNYVGTEHLLLGLVREGDGVAARVLNNLGVELKQVRSAVEFIIGRGETSLPGEKGMTPRSKKVIELAVDEARRLNHHYIGTEHLLLGMVREGEGIAAGVLESLGVSLDKVRDQVIRILNQSSYTSQPKISAANPFLQSYTFDLTEQVKQSVAGTVVGRNTEIERLMQILLRRSAHNPVLLGLRGVGKTAIIEALAQRIVRYEVPQQLLDCRLIVFDQAMNQKKYFEECQQFLAQIPDHKIIVVMDDFRQFLSHEAGPVGQLLKASIARKELQVIATSATEDWLDLYRSDWIIERSFQPIAINELVGDDLLAALQTAKLPYEAHHKLTYTSEALEAAIELGVKYDDGLAQPGKTLDLLDEAGSRFRMRDKNNPQGLKLALRGLHGIHEEIEAAAAAQQFELAEQLREQANRLRKEIEQTVEVNQENPNQSRSQITRQDIVETVATLYDLSTDDSE